MTLHAPHSVDPLAPVRPLWIRDDGYVACQDHLDDRASAQADRHPRQILVFSESHRWYKLNREDLSEFLLAQAVIACGRCGG